MIAKTASALQSEIQRVYYFSGRYRYSNKELACKATDIVSQYNKYIDPYNAFIESTDRMSEGAQQFALEAEQIFNELVNMVVKSLKKVIEDNRSSIDQMVETLMEKNHMNGNEIETICDK